MKIIDAQVHIWGSGQPSGHHRQVPVFPADALIKEMDEAGVDGAVLHPPSWDLHSNEMAVEAARQIPSGSAFWAGFRWTRRKAARWWMDGSDVPAWWDCAGL